jgi:hypothetical protein
MSRGNRLVVAMLANGHRDNTLNVALAGKREMVERPWRSKTSPEAIWISRRGWGTSKLTETMAVGLQGDELVGDTPGCRASIPWTEKFYPTSGAEGMLVRT